MVVSFPNQAPPRSSNASPVEGYPGARLFPFAQGLLAHGLRPDRTGRLGWAAPSDGTVVDVAVVDESMYLEAKVTRISISLSVFDVVIYAR